MQSDIVPALRKDADLYRRIGEDARADRFDATADEIERLRALTAGSAEITERGWIREASPNDAPVERLVEAKRVIETARQYRDNAGGSASYRQACNHIIESVQVLAALSSAPTAPVDCVACEGKPSAENSPCAICGRIAPTAPVVPDRPNAYCNKCGFLGQPSDDGSHKRPRDGETCNYTAYTLTPTDTADRREAVALIEQLRAEGCKNGGQDAYAWRARELCTKAADALFSLIAGPLPEGYVMVPVEPTEAMLDAALTTSTRFGKRAMRNIWRAMIAARPTGEQA